MKSLPLGTSDFCTLRGREQIYVDKTDLVNKLASLPQKFFLSRPRRFGKSLLISTFESLFKFGLRDFEGLKIEKLWKETGKFNVVRLDFSEIKQFSSSEEFRKRLDSLLVRRFRPCGFLYRPSDLFTVVDQISDWLRVVEKNSLVLLIDEYDAPLTACLNEKKIFEEVRGALSAFYATLKSNDGAIRFMFMTGITKFNKVSIFSELNNFSDITLDPEFGTILGYTPEETETYFRDYLKISEEALNLSTQDLMNLLIKNYDGFCFDDLASKRVFSPWSVLTFLQQPERGFKNYWFESGGKPSILLEYMKTHILRKPEEYSSEKSIRLSELSGSSSVDGLSDIGLLTQAGYLTIRSVKQNRAFLSYPNEEVSSSMAQLYTEQLLGGADLAELHAEGITTELARGNIEEVFQLLNKTFLAIDYQSYPIKDEASLRNYTQIFLSCFGLEPRVEVHNNKGRSDLEVLAGRYHWVFEFKVVREGESSETKLKEAVEQIISRDYGILDDNPNLVRIAMVYSLTKRTFTKWKEV